MIQVAFQLRRWVGFCGLLVLADALAGFAVASSMPEGSVAYAVGPSDPPDLSLWAGLRVGLGEHRFRIGGLYTELDGNFGVAPFPISELAYPLDVWMLQIGAIGAVADRWRISVELGKNLTSDAGKTTDSDWGVFYGPRSLDIYSESDTELEQVTVRAGVDYLLTQTLTYTVRLAAGYRYQHLEYANRNLDQRYPSLPWRAPDSVQGLVSTYEVTYRMPYLEVVCVYAFAHDLRLEGFVGVAPRVQARDKGNWLLRNKIFAGRTSGHAVSAGLNLQWDFATRWTAMAMVDTLAIRSDGSQMQNDAGRIELEIESDQRRMGLAVRRDF